MKPLVDVLAEAKSSGNFAAIDEAIPYARWLGISVESVAGELLSKMKFAPRNVGNPTIPALHGGTVGALLESAAIFQVLWELDAVVLPKTINITVDYLRSGRPVDVYAKAVITKRGRRVVYVRADAWQEDRSKPIASATVHFLVMTREE